ncbi:MAG: signal peptidase II [Bacilli bacterium]|nr:signal peptidase II [Bacilli bacterium]
MALIISIISVVVLIGIDQFTKFLAETYLLGNESIVLIDHVIEFTFSYNTGAAFSIFENFPYFPLLISIVGVLGIPYFFKDASFKRRPLYTISLILVYAGTWGNFIDRLLMVLGLKKGVVDFINFLFMDFAVFNFADICLTVGMILLCVYVFFFEQKDPLVLFKKKAKGETLDANGN